MVKIVVDNIGVEKLCEAITYDGCEWDGKLIPKNDTKHYFKYLIGWYYKSDYEKKEECTNYVYDFFLLGNIPETYQILVVKEIFEFDEILVFDFPDEETAFYFKLKFC